MGEFDYKESPSDIAYNSAANQFLVVWAAEPPFGGGQTDIWARPVSPAGATGAYIQIATTAGTERDAAAAYNPDSDQYLVVWESFDKATAAAEVIGRRLTGSGTVITTDSILISTGWAEDARPDVIYRAASGRYLAAWQQSPEATAAEEFADMFLGWNYNRWEMDPVNGDDLSVLGQARSDFMSRYMASWIALVINRERQKTR